MSILIRGVTPEQHRLLKIAAATAGVTLRQFILDAALAKAAPKARKP